MGRNGLGAFLLPFLGRLVSIHTFVTYPLFDAKVVIIFTSPNFFEKILTKSFLWTTLLTDYLSL